MWFIILSKNNFYGCPEACFSEDICFLILSLALLPEIKTIVSKFGAIYMNVILNFTCIKYSFHLGFIQKTTIFFTYVISTSRIAIFVYFIVY